MDTHHQYCRTHGQRLRRKFARRGFSAGEAVFLVFLALIMGGLLLLWLNHSRDESHLARCEDRQTKLGFALLAYDLINDRLPGWIEPAANAGDAAAANSWVVESLPYLGITLTPEELKRKEPFDPALRGPHASLHKDFVQTRDAEKLGPRRYLSALICPDDPRPLTNTADRAPLLGFVVNAGRSDGLTMGDDPPDVLASGVFLNRVADRNQVSSVAYVESHDGASHTLLLSENLDAGRWTDLTEPQLTFLWSAEGAPAERAILPINVRAGKGDGAVPFARPSARHGKGVNTVYVDGSSRFLNQDIDRRLFARLMTSDDAAAAP